MADNDIEIEIEVNEAVVLEVPIGLADQVATASQAEAETEDGANWVKRLFWTPQRIWQAVTAWAKTKLAGHTALGTVEGNITLDADGRFASSFSVTVGTTDGTIAITNGLAGGFASEVTAVITTGPALPGALTWDANISNPPTLATDEVQEVNFRSTDGTTWEALAHVRP